MKKILFFVIFTFTGLVKACSVQLLCPTCAFKNQNVLPQKVTVFYASPIDIDSLLKIK